MANDVILNKAASIERCLQRIIEEYAENNQNLLANQTKQDAIIHLKPSVRLRDRH